MKILRFLDSWYIRVPLLLAIGWFIGVYLVRAGIVIFG